MAFFRVYVTTNFRNLRILRPPKGETISKICYFTILHNLVKWYSLGCFIKTNSQGSRIMEGISVIIPVYNEKECVVDSYREIRDVLENMRIDYEIIFVDDGSKDGTVSLLKEVGKGDPNLRIIEFRRNFGQTAAMSAGFDLARFDVVATLDGDLQNDPRDIPKMVAKLNEGYDFVAGWRKNRKDRFFSRILPSQIANRVISWFTKVPLHDYGCTLKVIRGEISRGIRLYGEMHRFIPALADELGAKIVELPVNHRPRTRGTSKYGMSRMFRVILDLLTVKFLTGFSKRPIHLFGGVGMGVGLAGFLLMVYLMIDKFAFGIDMGNRPLMSLGIMLITVGFQFLLFGLLGEVSIRTYYESQDKKTYIIREIHEKNHEGHRSIKISERKTA